MKIGIIKYGRELGRLGHNASRRFIWLACKDCGKERWVNLADIKYLKHKGKLCRHCRASGSKSKNWKGSRRQDHRGYIHICLDKNDFFHQMVSAKNYVLEHRLVMAKHLGRCLQSWESVHHKNGIRDDNRLENLELTTRGSHFLRHSKGYRDGYQQGYQDGQSEAIKELKQEIRLLRWHILPNNCEIALNLNKEDLNG